MKSKTAETTANKTADLSNFDTCAAGNEGAEMKLLNPETGEELGPVFVLAGADSDVYVSKQRKNINKRLRNKRGAKGIDAELIESEAIDLLAECTLNWRDVVLDGETLPFSKNNARELYTRFPWIREQADAFIGDRANFIKKS